MIFIICTVYLMRYRCIFVIAISDSCESLQSWERGAMEEIIFQYYISSFSIKKMLCLLKERKESIHNCIQRRSQLIVLLGLINDAHSSTPLSQLRRLLPPKLTWRGYRSCFPQTLRVRIVITFSFRLTYTMVSWGFLVHSKIFPHLYFL